jgi:RNA polymerase sigma-70 factor (ECF subfamily)
MSLVAVSETDAASFHIVRPRLFGIAYRVLGSASEADDVVQDAWIRWQRTHRGAVRDPAAFLATMTARLALTVGQSARARHEISSEPLEADAVDVGADPSRVVEQREALELAVRALSGRPTSFARRSTIPTGGSPTC